MALKVFDGFDHYGTQADMQARAQGSALMWNDIPGGGIVDFVAGRGGYGYAAAVAGGLNPIGVGASFSSNYTAAFASIATLILPVNVAWADYMVMDYTANAAQITLRCMFDSGTILAYSGDPLIGGTLLGASPPNAFAPYIWNKVEVGVTIGASGSFDIHFNGNSAFSMSGINTQPTGNAWFNGFKVRFSGSAENVSPQAYIDDFNLNDTTTGPGTYPCNSFLGDCATRTLRTAANSTVSWTPLANTNWQEVNSAQFVGDGAYNYATTVGLSDSFTFGSLPTTVSAVFGVQITGAYRKLDASAQTILQSMKSNGTSVSGAVWPMSLNYSYVTDLVVLDPHTGATWLASAVNALIAGYTLNS